MIILWLVNVPPCRHRPDLPDHHVRDGQPPVISLLLQASPCLSPEPGNTCTCGTFCILPFLYLPGTRQHFWQHHQAVHEAACGGQHDFLENIPLLESRCLFQFHLLNLIQITPVLLLRSRTCCPQTWPTSSSMRPNMHYHIL